MHISNVIQQLGYPSSQVKIYLAALDLGEATITDLAGKVSMPRTSVQSIIEEMHKKGLMNYYLKRRRRYWVAENPEKLMISLKEREAALKSIMPELQSKRFAQGGRPIVRVYHGPEEIKLIMENMIDSKKHINAIISWDDWRFFFGDDYVDDFIENRYKHFLRIRLLTPKTPSSISLKERDSRELRQTRFLPTSMDIKNTNFIYDNTFAIISLNKRQPVGIVMEDPDIAHTASLLFESTWAQSSER